MATEEIQAVRTKVPESYPQWAKRLADVYFGGAGSVFILHGNVHDLIAAGDGAKPREFLGVVDFLAFELFGAWDVVLQYDLSRGIRVLGGRSKQRQAKMVQDVTELLGPMAQWPRDPQKALVALDLYVERRVLTVPEGQKPPSIAIIFDQAELLVPGGEYGGRDASVGLATFLGWAKSPYIRRLNMAFCMIADRLADMAPALARNPYVTSVEMPQPSENARLAFIDFEAGDRLAGFSDYPAALLAQQAAGLTLANLDVLLRTAERSGRRLDAETFKALKKDLIERECLGLLEFISPPYTLDNVVGASAAKARLLEDAELIRRGNLKCVPMGYLICGPVGTGKTFTAECYAGSVGIPCVTLRNFRSKYVGETEGNLEKILRVLRAMGPVAVIVDEADAALGDREQEGDSGVGGRVFGMFAEQMGNTRYRGKIIWFLLTSRPDLLPIDLKRQGRAEVHIPLFAPATVEEIREMFAAMARKRKVDLSKVELPDISPAQGLTGADFESILVRGERLAALRHGGDLTTADLREASATFIPTTDNAEKELQLVAALLECSDAGFLPEPLRASAGTPEQRQVLKSRYLALKTR